MSQHGVSIFGWNCHKYNFCRDKTFVSTNIILSQHKFCRGMHSFVATKDVFCRHEHVFVATNTRDKHVFVPTKLLRHFEADTFRNRPTLLYLSLNVEKQQRIAHQQKALKHWIIKRHIETRPLIIIIIIRNPT